MKKILALILALVMVLCLVACNKDDGEGSTPSGSGDPSSSSEPSNEPSESTPPEPPQGEELPASPLYYNGFDNADGLTSVHQVDKAEDPTLTGANFALVPSKHEILIADGYGVAGSSLMLDGKYGVSVNDFPKTTDDSYTIAFWYAADRYSQYGPLVQMGRNVGMNDTENEVCWINFTKADAWSVEAGECAPVAWNRNSMPGGDSTKQVWPWIGNNVDLKGKKEWVHVALVVDGVAYDDALGAPHVGATMYVNGVEVMKADASVIGTKDEAGVDTSANWMGVAPNIFNGDGVKGIECLLGVNYWDQYSKEYIDEFYFYDEALTAGQVATLYGMGTAPEYQSMPKYEGPTDDEGDTPEPTDPVLPEITPDANAIVALGTPERTLGFWTEHTASYELPEGKAVTFKLNNYSDATQNYRNFCTVLCGTALEANNVDPNTVEGYKEYAVVRPDSWAWSGTVNPIPDLTYETSWGDDWAGWLNLMKDAEVTLTLTRTGTTVAMDYTFTGADGTVMTEKVTMPLNASGEVAADAPVYAFIGGEGAYIELLSVE